MIGYLKYFTNNFGLVRTVKILCDVTVLCANDSLHRVCFPTVCILQYIFSSKTPVTMRHSPLQLRAAAKRRMLMQGSPLADTGIQVMYTSLQPLSLWFAV